MNTKIDEMARKMSYLADSARAFQGFSMPDSYYIGGQGAINRNKRRKARLNKRKLKKMRK